MFSIDNRFEFSVSILLLLQNLPLLLAAILYLAMPDSNTTVSFLHLLTQSRDVMRDYSACLATRGLIFANKRRADPASGGGGGGWRPLHKPQWFEAFKQVGIIHIFMQSIVESNRTY